MKFVQHKKMLLRVAAGVFAALALTFGFVPQVLADTYNCGAYGAGAYQNNVCGAATDDGGGLADTGQKIWPILIAVLLILLGTYILYRTRKKMKQQSYQALK